MLRCGYYPFGWEGNKQVGSCAAMMDTGKFVLWMLL